MKMDLIPSCEWGSPRIYLFFFYLHKKDVFSADFEVNNAVFTIEKFYEKYVSLYLY